MNPPHLYASVDGMISRALETFRANNPPQSVEIEQTTWEYLATGQGKETILFLHGMTGAYDIWWQQIEALQEQYRVISVTYPAVDTLEGLTRGVLATLGREQVTQVNLVGTSLGGYLAQYFLAKHPDLIQRVCLGNTFPPNDLIVRKNRWVGAFLPFLPEPLVLSTVRKSVVNAIYPAANHSELVSAFLLELLYGKMSKAQFAARFRCVIEPFSAPALHALGIPAMIIESDNDPLVEGNLREQLKATYPSATVHTLHHVGHFPYLNEPAMYTRLIEEWLRM
jgi:maspardin